MHNDPLDVTSNVALHNCKSTYLISSTPFVILLAKLMSCRVLGNELVVCNYSGMYFKIQKSLDCDCHTKN